jgi:hypothetical protein
MISRIAMISLDAVAGDLSWRPAGVNPREAGC